MIYLRYKRNVNVDERVRERKMIINGNYELLN